MGSPNISSSQKRKCSLTNKHVRIIRNLAEKKKSHDEQFLNRQLFKIRPGSYGILDAEGC